MKGNQKGGTNKKFDDAFEKYSKMLPKEYKDQFKKPEYAGDSKKDKVKNALRKGDAVIVSKGVTNKKTPGVNIAKALDENAEIEIKTPPKEIATQVQKARLDAKMSQEDLAKAISEKFNVIKDLEACEGKYDPQVVVKIEKKLGVKFTRSWKK